MSVWKDKSDNTDSKEITF